MAERVRVLRTDEVEKIWFGRPTGHRHFRLAVQIADGPIFVFPEAVVAAIVRAFVSVKTHPTKRAVALAVEAVQNRKRDFAALQLIETQLDDEKVAAFLAELLAQDEASHFDPP